MFVRGRAQSRSSKSPTGRRVRVAQKFLGPPSPDAVRLAPRGETRGRCRLSDPRDPPAGGADVWGGKSARRTGFQVGPTLKELVGLSFEYGPTTTGWGGLTAATRDGGPAGDSRTVQADADAGGGLLRGPMDSEAAGSGSAFAEG